MKIRFQADADLHPGIGLGLMRRDRRIDWLAAGGSIPDGAPDSEVLRIAASDRRVLVSRDIGTMPGHFSAFVAIAPSPGAIVVPSSTPIGAAIERLLVIWQTPSANELENQIWWLS